MVGFLIIRHCDSALSDLHVDAWLDGKNAPPLRSGSMPEKEEERALLTILGVLMLRVLIVMRRSRPLTHHVRLSDASMCPGRPGRCG